MSQTKDRTFPNPLPQHFRRNVRLVTGATGFLGKRLLPLLEPKACAPVICLVRATDDRQARERGLAITDNPHVLWLRGDICEAQLGLNNATWQALAAATQEIFHSAASVEFNLPLAEAHHINVGGTARLLDLANAAQKVEGFRCLHHVSTAYAAGRCAGPVTADHLPDDQARNFRNSYERTKARAERLLRSQNRIPVSIYRPSIIAGATHNGATDNWNVLYAPMRQIQRGLLPFMPKSGAAYVDSVGVDYVAEGIAHLAQLPQQGCTAYHLTAGSQCFNIDEFVATCNARCERLEQDFVGQCQVISGRQWQLMKWKVKAAAGVPKTSTSLFGQGAGKLRRWGKLAERALKGFSPYEPYTGVSTLFDNTWEQRELSQANIAMPHWSTYLPRIVDYALQVDFGNSEPQVSTRAVKQPLATKSTSSGRAIPQAASSSVVTQLRSNMESTVSAIGAQ